MTNAPHQRPRFGLRSIVAIILLFLPGIIVGFTAWSAGAELLFVGLIPALVALLYGPRLAIATSIYTAILIGVVQLAIPHPIAAVLLMVVVGLVIGVSSLGGVQTPIVVGASWPAVLLLEEPVRIWSGVLPHGTVADALVAALFTLVGGMFTVLVGAVLIPDIPRSPRKPVDRPTAFVYGLTLALVLGAATAALTVWGERSLGGWILLTILVVARPTFTETRRRLVLRTLGTVAGGALAAVLVLIIPVSWVLTTLGILALVLAVLLQLKKANYAIYAGALTATVVLLNSHGGNRLVVDLERVVFTVVGAVIAAAVLIVLQSLLARRVRR
jgi:hypothetical protein